MRRHQSEKPGVVILKEKVPAAFAGRDLRAEKMTDGKGALGGPSRTARISEPFTRKTLPLTTCSRA